MRRAAAVLLACAAVAAGGCGAARPAPPRAGVGDVAVLERRPGGGTRFVGSAACGSCHPGAFARWGATAHARALGALGPGSRLDPACLRCHATGYGDPLGYRDAAATPGLAAVGCEACHGAGGDHARSRWPALVVPDLRGDCAPCDANRVCRGCHTAAHSPGFELARDLARVSCSGAAAGR